MIRQIPFKPFPSFIEEITLSGVPYVFKFQWNSRAELWVMDILDREENELIVGIPLLIQYEILGLFADMGLPPGKLYVIDTIQTFKPIEYDDFTNGRAVLFFEEVV